MDLAGRLDLAGAPSVRQVLRKCAARAPAAILVGLAGLTVIDDQYLTVFRTVEPPDLDTPPRLLIHSSPELAERLRLTCGEHTSVYDTALDALTAVATAAPPPRRVVHMALDPVPDAPARARHMIDDACRRWGLTYVLRPALVITSELVSNAVQHAGRERGRGLSLVDAYATAWGSVSTATGKTVWATIRTTRSDNRRARSPSDAGER